MPPKRDRSPNARGGGAAAPSAITWAVLFPSLSADQKNGVARLVASLALQYHSKKEILESSEVSKAVKTFLGVSDIRIKLDTDVLPLANDLLFSKIRMRAVEIRRQNQTNPSIVLQNQLKPALFSEFILPFIHTANTDQFCADITDAGQLMFILGSIVLYPQCRIELSVLRQQMLECGGKKILLGADAVQGRDADEAFGEALDKTLEHMRKFFYIELASANSTEAAGSEKFVTLGSRALLEFGKVGLLHFVLNSMGIADISDEEIVKLIGCDPAGRSKEDKEQIAEDNSNVVAEFRALQTGASHGVVEFRGN